MGDSITIGWRLDESFPGKPYVNRGVSGQTTPQMLVRMFPDAIDLKPAQTTVTLPAGIELSVLVPISPGHSTVLLNGKPVTPSPLSEDGTRATVLLSQPGTYTLETK